MHPLTDFRTGFFQPPKDRSHQWMLPEFQKVLWSTFSLFVSLHVELLIFNEYQEAEGAEVAPRCSRTYWILLYCQTTMCHGAASFLVRLHWKLVTTMDPGEEKRRSTLQPRRYWRSQSGHNIVAHLKAHNEMKHHSPGPNMIWSWSSFFRIYVVFTLLVLAAVLILGRAPERRAVHKGKLRLLYKGPDVNNIDLLQRHFLCTSIRCFLLLREDTSTRTLTLNTLTCQLLMSLPACGGLKKTLTAFTSGSVSGKVNYYTDFLTLYSSEYRPTFVNFNHASNALFISI